MSSTRTGSVRRRHTRTCASRDGGRCRCEGAWQYRARTPDGGRVEQGGFPTKDDAQKALRALLRDVDRGTFRRIEPVAFDEYARGWLAAVRPTIRPSTHASYSQIVRTHLEPHFGSMMVGASTTAHVRAFVAAKSAARRRNGKPAWKPATVRNALVCLKMILSAAVEDGHAATNPAAKVSPPKVERPETEILTAAELDRVYAVAGEPWEALFRFLSWTGCRRGEALALRWGDVDLPAGRGFIRRSLGKFGEGAPKSAAGRRTVPLPPSLSPCCAATSSPRHPTAPRTVGGSSGRAPAEPSTLTTSAAPGGGRCARPAFGTSSCTRCATSRSVGW